MKFKLHILISCFALLLVGCNNNEEFETDRKLQLNDDYIKFSVLNEGGSRTEYYGTNDCQIKWTNGDKVEVFCDGAVSTSHATYEVDVNGTNEANLLPNTVTPLQWGTKSSYNFYSVYPGGSDKVVFSDDGKVVALKMNQSVTKEISNNSNANYFVSYDMSDAYMVSKVSTPKTNAPVVMKFDPIMTTYKVTLTNKSGETLSLSGLIVKINNDRHYIQNGMIQYDIDNKCLVPFLEGTFNSVEYFNVFTRQSAQNQYIDLGPGKQVELTVFLPPLPADYVTEENPITMLVNATYEYSKKVQITSSITSSKTNINIGLNTSDGSWPELIDDNVYVSQLSIPGASWVGCQTSAARNNAVFSGHAIQGWDTKTLWNNGIRVFDFHADANLKAFQVESYGYTIYNLFDDLNAMLDKNPKDFAIIILRQEDGGDQFTKWNAFATKYWSSPRAIEFNPDMIVEDIRNKILIIALDWGYDMSKFSANIAKDQWPSAWAASYISSGWYTNKTLKTGQIVSKNGTTGKVLASDFVRLDNDLSAKFKLIYEHLNAAQARTDNTWSIMTYTSVWNSTWNSNNFASATGSLTQTQQRDYSWDNGASLMAKNIDKGSCGIVLLPFIGYHTTYSNSTHTGIYTPSGDLLVTGIIQRNFVNNLIKKTSE